MNPRHGSRIELALNRLKAGLRRSGSWRWLPQDEIGGPLSIRSLVYPLRYDILVRKGLYDLYAANRELCRRDPESFLDLAEQHPYHVWFTRVLLVRFPQAGADSPGGVRRLFARRVESALALRDSIAADGFDPARPIEPFTGRTILPADSGRVLHRKYFAGDGCHRLACLMSLGHEVLPQEFVRVRCYRRLVPIDNTALLEPHMTITWPADWPVEDA